MVTVGMNYRVVPGREVDFERVFDGVVKILSEELHHVSTRLYRACEGGADYLILSEWSDRAAFEGFVGSEAFGRITSWSLDGVLRGRPSHEVFERASGGEDHSHEGVCAAPGCPVAGAE